MSASDECQAVPSSWYDVCSDCQKNCQSDACDVAALTIFSGAPVISKLSGTLIVTGTPVITCTPVVPCAPGILDMSALEE